MNLGDSGKKSISIDLLGPLILSLSYCTCKLQIGWFRRRSELELRGRCEFVALIYFLSTNSMRVQCLLVLTADLLGVKGLLIQKAFPQRYAKLVPFDSLFILPGSCTAPQSPLNPSVAAAAPLRLGASGSQRWRSFSSACLGAPWRATWGSLFLRSPAHILILCFSSSNNYSPTACRGKSEIYCGARVPIFTEQELSFNVFSKIPFSPALCQKMALLRTEHSSPLQQVIKRSGKTAAWKSIRLTGNKFAFISHIKDSSVRIYNVPRSCFLLFNKKLVFKSTD